MIRISISGEERKFDQSQPLLKITSKSKINLFQSDIFTAFLIDRKSTKDLYA